MDQFVSFQAVGLGKLGGTFVTFVGFLSGVDPQVPLQFERVWTGVGAVGTLKTNRKFININRLNNRTNFNTRV